MNHGIECVDTTLDRARRGHVCELKQKRLHQAGLRCARLDVLSWVSWESADLADIVVAFKYCLAVLSMESRTALRFRERKRHADSFSRLALYATAIIAASRFFEENCPACLVFRREITRGCPDVHCFCTPQGPGAWRLGRGEYSFPTEWWSGSPRSPLRSTVRPSHRNSRSRTPGLWCANLSNSGCSKTTSAWGGRRWKTHGSPTRG